MRELDLGAGNENLGLPRHPGSHPGLRPARKTGAARLWLELPRLLGREPARLREGLLPRGCRESPGGSGLAECGRLLPVRLPGLRLTGLWLTERLLSRLPLSRLPLAVRRLVVRMRHARSPR
ncbi:hypothetical protein [Saccharomonospora halophila]|uniref:hypothetical protein n=1 Tax=Saccharomonospora halophila TaxID=129922 RepID=UPI0012F7305A|nr:hypothetical protein [Saccharomonospora halophila]